VLTPRAYQRGSLPRVSTISNLGACFALRCFQRLSLIDIATERSTWRQSS